MYNEVKKFMPNILGHEIRQEKFKRGEVDPQYLAMMRNHMAMRTPQGNTVLLERPQSSNESSGDAGA